MVQQVPDSPDLLVPALTQVGHVAIQVPARLLCDLCVLAGVFVPSLNVLLSGMYGELAGIIFVLIVSGVFCLFFHQIIF